MRIMLRIQRRTTGAHLRLAQRHAVLSPSASPAPEHVPHAQPPLFSPLGQRSLKINFLVFQKSLIYREVTDGGPGHIQD